TKGGRGKEKKASNAQTRRAQDAASYRARGDRARGSDARGPGAPEAEPPQGRSACPSDAPQAENGGGEAAARSGREAPRQPIPATTGQGRAQRAFTAESVAPRSHAAGRSPEA